MARIALIGRTGQVGHELLPRLQTLGEVVAPDRSQADLMDPDSLRRFVREIRPSLVVNAAADTAVDRAESEWEACHAANAIAPSVLASACAEYDARLLHYSTDYVFDGTKGTPYVEDDATHPVNAYGRAKLEGDQGVLIASERHLVIRLSWVYAARGRNFALTMLRLAREGKPLRVVSDQIGSPTYAEDIADTTLAVASQLLAQPEQAGGIFHMTASGSTSWHDFAQTLLNEALGQDAPTVAPIPSEAFPTPAARPRYSVLDNEKLGMRFGVRMPSWRDGVRRWAAAVGRD